MAGVFDALVSEIATVTQTTRLGRVIEVARGTVTVRGLENIATLGDRVEIGNGLGGEVVSLRTDSISMTFFTGDARSAVTCPLMSGTTRYARIQTGMHSAASARNGYCQ